ncbi:LysR family transcriptional regulator, partial [Aeromonas salmonicida]
MKLHQLDLNLLLAFDALMTQGSVTRAAEALFISQPAMSHALGRLRTFFGDPLLVRTPQGMLPTPRAQR